MRSKEGGKVCSTVGCSVCPGVGGVVRNGVGGCVREITGDVLGLNAGGTVWPREGDGVKAGDEGDGCRV